MIDPIFFTIFIILGLLAGGGAGILLTMYWCTTLSTAVDEKIW